MHFFGLFDLFERILKALSPIWYIMQKSQKPSLEKELVINELVSYAQHQGFKVNSNHEKDYPHFPLRNFHFIKKLNFGFRVFSLRNFSLRDFGLRDLIYGT